MNEPVFDGAGNPVIGRGTPCRGSGVTDQECRGAPSGADPNRVGRLGEPRVGAKAKPRWDLLPLDALNEVAKVLAVGAEKYAENSWHDTPEKFFVGALCRHLEAFVRGEEFDKDLAERGLKVSHAACMVANSLFLLWKAMHREE